jgi:hypothetical protein
MTMGASLERMKMIGLSFGDSALRNLGFDLSDFLLELSFNFGVRSVGMTDSLLQFCSIVGLCLVTKLKDRWVNIW